MKLLATSIHLSVLAFLTACGGGGGGGGALVTTSFSGKVIDGYIKNAKVCLDLNSNLKCDDGPGGEEAAYTKFSGDGGSYSFTYTGTRDIASLHIIAEATADSMDEDDLGKTFAQANRNPVSLLTPANAPETVSPLTTLVSNQQITAKEEGKTLTTAEAESRVKVAANLPSNMPLTGNDYKDPAKGNADTAVIAKAVTLALADTQATIKTNADFQTAAKDSGKTASTEAIKQATASVISDLSKNINADGKLAVTAAAFQENAAKTITGNIQQIVKVAAAPKTDVWDPASYLKKGMFFLSIQDGEWFGDGKTPEQAIRVSGPMPSVGGVKQSSDGTKLTDARDWAIKTSGGAYEKTYEWGPNYYLVDAGWVKETSTKVNSVTQNGNCFTLKQDGYQSQEICGKSKSWAGKTVNEAGFCTTATKNTFFKTCVNPDLKFPDGAISNDFSITSLADQYEVWGVDQGPNITYNYKQVGTVITITAPNHGIGVNSDIILDFTSGASTDGIYGVASVIDANTFTVVASKALTSEGTVLRYWGGWFSEINRTKEVTLENFIQSQISDTGSYIWLESCTVAGQFITDTTSSSGYSVSWSKGKQDTQGYCSVDTSIDAKKYIQTTKLSIITSKGQRILKSVYPDILKTTKDKFYGSEVIWAVVKDSAGIKGVYNGELKQASVTRVVESGTKEAIGNRSFIETINKAWGYAELPSDASFFP